MEENLNEKAEGFEETPEETAQTPSDNFEEQSEAATPPTEKTSWKDRFESENAVRVVYLVFGFCVIVLLMVLLQFSTSAICCGDWDGYYHIRWSAMIWENFKQFKWLPDFTWLPLTVLNSKDYADHHFLFHLLQIPFLWFFKPVMAAKISAVFYGSLAIFSVYWMMYKYKVEYLLVWLAALLTCSGPFFYRMNMAKAPPLTIIYSIVGIYLLFKRKYVWLLPLMFVFVWTYSLYPLLFVASAIWAAVIAWNERKFEWQPLAYSAGGIVLGNVINPYFPNNLNLFFEHFYTKMRASFEVSVGGEWYPYDGMQLLTHLTVALIAMLLGYIVFKPRNGQLPEKATFFLVFSTILLIWMFRSKRLAEYFPPFAILFGAFSLRAFMKPDTPQLPEEFTRDIEPFLDSGALTEQEENVGLVKQAAPWMVGALLVGSMYYNFIGLNLPSYGISQTGLTTTISKNEADDKYQEAMIWANANIPAGERIFNCNWDDFPKLFFFNTKHSYVFGLDPNYLYSKNPDLYRLVKDITSGKVDDPAPLIKEKLQAKYIFSDAKQCEDFLAKTLESGWADTVYEDGEAFILKIRDEQGDPPTPDDEPADADEEAKLEEAEANDSKNVNTGNDANNASEEDDPDEEIDDGEDDEEDPINEEEEEEPDEGNGNSNGQ